MGRSTEMGCQGCSNKDGCYIVESLKECPCINCLIKPRCSQHCEERSLFYHNQRKVYIDDLHRKRSAYVNIV
jgi:hypothetical protein